MSNIWLDEYLPTIAKTVYFFNKDFELMKIRKNMAMVNFSNFCRTCAVINIEETIPDKIIKYLDDRGIVFPKDCGIYCYDKESDSWHKEQTINFDELIESEEQDND